jgi:hypothetical protein
MFLLQKVINSVLNEYNGVHSHQNRTGDDDLLIQVVIYLIGLRGGEGYDV